MIADQLAHRSAAEGLGGAIEAKPIPPTTIWAFISLFAAGGCPAQGAPLALRLNC
jgi:hypothetical protein